LPAKFADTIREALGCEAPRPAGCEGIESKAQRFALMPADVPMLKQYIAARCPALGG
jgi:threonine synthase